MDDDKMLNILNEFLPYTDAELIDKTLKVIKDIQRAKLKRLIWDYVQTSTLNPEPMQELKINIDELKKKFEN